MIKLPILSLSQHHYGLLRLVALFFLVAQFHGAANATENKQDLQELREAVKQFLVKESTGIPGTVSVEVGSVDSRLKLAKCESLDTVLSGGNRLWGRTTVGVRCNAPEHWSIFVPATVKVTGSYFVSAKPITQGQLITENDIAPMQGDLTSMSNSIVTDSSQAVGHISSLSLGAGIALRQDSLHLQQAVIQGQTIRLISNGDGFKVSTEAVALNSANAGQLVKVKINSGQVISGTAKTGGVVEVSN